MPGPPLAGQTAVVGAPPEEDPQSVTVVPESFFYKGLPGSDMYIGPLDVILNKGFNFSQVENRDRRIF